MDYRITLLTLNPERLYPGKFIFWKRKSQFVEKKGFVRKKKNCLIASDKKPTASGVPRRSPIQVLTRLNVA